jgi:hypothetical protein
MVTEEGAWTVNPRPRLGHGALGGWRGRDGGRTWEMKRLHQMITVDKAQRKSPGRNDNVNHGSPDVDDQQDMGEKFHWSPARPGAGVNFQTPFALEDLGLDVVVVC